MFPSEFPVLETERLVLRQLEPRDAPALFEMMSDRDTMRYAETAPMAEVAQAEALISRHTEGFAAGKSIRWGLTLHEKDRVIGTCSLFQIDLDCRRAEIGYILRRDHWGHGYNNEAALEVIKYAFAGLDLNRIEAELDPRNAASVKAVRRLGFVEEGLLRERWIVSGEVSDSLMAGLLRSDWDALRG